MPLVHFVVALSVGQFYFPEQLSPAPVDAGPSIEGVPGEYPWFSVKLIPDADLRGTSFERLRIIRNEIFARHGYQFKSRMLREHFETFYWYKGEHANVDALLSPIEKKNVEVLREAERKADEARIAALPEGLRTFWLAFRAAVAKRDLAQLEGMAQFPFQSTINPSYPELDPKQFRAMLKSRLSDETLEAVTLGVPEALKDGSYFVSVPGPVAFVFLPSAGGFRFVRATLAAD
jgi:hypothetical protein